MYSSTTELENASSQIINAINKMSEENFKRMTEIMTEYSYSCYFFYGLKIDALATGNYAYSDPRKNEDYLIFASKNQVQNWFVYYDSETKAYNPARINNVIEYFNNNVSICIDYINEIQQQMDINQDFDKVQSLYGSEKFQICKRVAQFYAGLKFWGKDTEVENAVNGRSGADYFFKITQLKTIATKFNNTYTDVYQKLQKRTATDIDIKKYNGGFYIPECSFSSDKLAAEYQQNKEEYQRHVQDLYKCLLSVNELTLCYNQAVQGANNFNIGGSDDTTIINQNTITQVLNCCKDEQNKVFEKMEELVKTNTVDDLTARTVLLEKSISEIRELLNNMANSPEEAKQLNTILDEALNSRIQEIEESINTLNVYIVIIFIILFILFIIIVCGFGFTYVKMFKR